MPINYQCPQCGAEGVAEDQYAGQTGPCASCGTQITMPAVGAAEVRSAVVAAGGGPPAKKGSSAPIWIAVVAGVLLCSVCVIGLLAAMLLPAIQAAREAARRNTCTTNIRQISLAMHLYEDTYGSLPPAYTVDEEGNKLHSWRTLLLPFLEQNALANQIDMDEPWDSPANLPYHDTMVSVFNCPSSSGNPYDTSYMVVVGDETIFPPDGKALSLTDIADGTGSTIMIVEVSGTHTHWMEPSDLEFDNLSFMLNAGPSDPASEHPGQVMVGFADGSARSISEDIDPTVLRSQLTRGGGEVVEQWDW